MSDNREQHWWAISRDEQKRRIEDAVGWYLSQDFELSDRQKLLLRDTIGHAFRGLFGLAAQNICDMNLPEDAWAESAKVQSVMVVGVDRKMLQQALNDLRTSPTQTRVVFM